MGNRRHSQVATTRGFVLAMGALLPLWLVACQSAGTIGPSRTPGPGVLLPTPALSSTVAATLPATENAPAASNPTENPAPSGSPEGTKAPQELGVIVAGDGPWLMYCDDGQRGRVLVDLSEGGRRNPVGDPCWRSTKNGYVIGAAVVDGESALGLFRLPEVELLRAWPGVRALDDPWSPSGRYLMMESSSGTGRRALYAYDIVKDRRIELVSEDRLLLPMGWSPQESWFVVSRVEPGQGGESDHGQVLALTPGGGPVRELHRITQGDARVDHILGWLSDNTYIAATTVELCNLDLYRYNIISEEYQRILGWNYAQAMAPDGTIFTVSYDGGPCPADLSRGLYRLTAAGGWTPSPVSGTSQATAIDSVRWLPALELFASCERYPGSASLMLRRTSGQVVGRYSCTDKLYPSPNGGLLLVVSQDGRLALDEPAGGDSIELGSLAVRSAIWSQSAEWLALVDDSERLYLAGQQEGWHLRMIDPKVDARFMPAIVRRPPMRFRSLCPSAPASRLKLGDVAQVSLHPDAPSRLRQQPGLDSEVVQVIGPGTQVRIVGGPTCLDDFVWWQAETADGDSRGWAVEGNWVSGWLVPIGD